MRAVLAIATGAVAAVAFPRPATADDTSLLPAEAPPLAYRIDVSVDPDSRRFEGTVDVRVRDPGSVPPAYRFYLNGFAHEATTWMRTADPRRGVAGILEEGEDDPWGWLVPVTVACAPGPDDELRPAEAHWIVGADGNTLDRTVLALDDDACGNAARHRLRFRGRFPRPIARTGGVEDWLMGAQWFPKLIGVQALPGSAEPVAVDGPFFGPTEFFANFADYDVRIAAPRDWTVVATGGDPVETSETADPDDEVRRFRQRWVHDFAFVVARRVSVRTRDHRPPGRRQPVSIRAVLPEGLAHQSDRMLATVATSLDVLGGRVGTYPYDVITVVAPPAAADRTAGMEYPTLIVGMVADPLWDRLPDFRMPELVVAHEFAHQYFYGLLATNERDEAWLDEGFTDYWTWEILRAQWGRGRELGSVFGRRIDGSELQRFMMRGRSEGTGIAPAAVPSHLSPPSDTGRLFYRRPATLLRTARDRFGAPVVDRVFRAWFRRHRFGHPTGADFREVLDDEAPPAMVALLADGLAAPFPPDFAVTDLRVVRLERPRGVLPGIGLDGDPPRPPAGGDALGLGRAEEGISVLVHEPGSGALYVVPEGSGQRGARRLERWSLVPSRAGTGKGGGSDERWRTRFRLEGPGRAGWPTTVSVRFEDGSAARGRWDGRAPYVDVELVAPSPVREVRVQSLPADPYPTNDGRRSEPDDGFAWDWSLWFAGLVHGLVSGLGAWL